MTHFSKEAWNTINTLTGTRKGSPPSVNDIANCLVDNGKFPNHDRAFTRLVNTDLKAAWNAPSADLDLCAPFTPAEMADALKSLKSGKAAGPDNLHTEFYQHLAASAADWLRKFFSSCMTHLKIPKIWRKARVIALLKPNKPANEAKSYRHFNHSLQPPAAALRATSSRGEHGLPSTECAPDMEDSTTTCTR